MSGEIHPITEAKLEALDAIVESTVTDEDGNQFRVSSVDINRLNDGTLGKAKDILGREVTLLRAWPIESQYPDSALVLIDNGEEQVFVMVRGNAGRQAVYLDGKQALPTRRILATLGIEGNRTIHYWRKPASDL